MTDNAYPSRNQAKDDTLSGLLDLFREKLLQDTDDMLPAKVIAYDRGSNRAQVQPLIVVVNTKNQQTGRAPIASVPVLQIGGGGFVMSFPIQPGDIGWIKANDRDISFFKEGYTQAAPNTQRKKSFSDGVFIPDSFMKNVIIAGEDEANLVIQNTAGTVRISLFEDKIKFTAPEIVFDTPLMTITGDVEVDGDVSSDTISLHNHVHGGVQTGGGNTGAPV